MMYLRTSLKWSAHSPQGYMRDNIAICTQNTSYSMQSLSMPYHKLNDQFPSVRDKLIKAFKIKFHISERDYGVG